MTKFLSFTSIFSIALITFLIGLTHYDSTNSPDFGRYFYSYNNYYIGEKAQTGLEQGNLYFYFIAKFISLNSELILDPFLSEYLNYKIQLVNFIFFNLGLFFIYLYLRELKIEIKIITVCIISIIFFPPLIALRLIYKPEIFLFFLFFISLYTIEKFINTNKEKYLLIFSLTTALMLSVKLVSGLILIIYLFIYLYKKKLTNILFANKKLILIFLVTFVLLSFENYTINGYVFYNHQTPIEYQNKANISFLYNFDIRGLIYQPFQHNFKDSALSIILLETFDDYFNIYWNNDKSIFNVGQVSIFKIQFFTQYLAIFLTSLYYFLVIFFSIKIKKHASELLSPFLGIIFMLLISLFIQFNPNTGDQIKNYYYSSLLVFSLIYIILLMSKSVKFKVLIFIIIIQIFATSIIVGFPKNYSLNMELKIIDQFIATDICNLIDDIVNFPKNKDCINNENICKISMSYNLSPEFKGGKWVYKLYNPNEVLYLSDDNKVIQVFNIEECNKNISDGFKVLNTEYNLRNKIPLFSVLVLLIILFFSINKKSKKIFKMY